MIWIAGFRTGVLSPYEPLQFGEPRGFADQTVRQVLHLAGGGEAFRVRLTNRYGRTPLTIGAATVAVGDRRAVLTFGGAERGVVPSGEEAVTDPVDFLNRRLQRGWVVNQGIAGNRLLRDGVGEHALARFDRDVLSIPALTHVLVHFGINDLGLPGMLGEPPVTADDLVEGFRALADRAHSAGLRILAATIGPFAGAGPEISTPEGLAVRAR